MEYLLSCFSSCVEPPGANLALVLFIVVLLPVSAWLLYKKSLDEDKKKNLPPGPRPWPILGNFPSFMTGDLPHRAFHKLAQKYGGLMFLRLGSQPCIIVSSVDVMKEVFERHDTAFLSRAPSLAAEVITGYKMFSFAPYGPYWSRMRRLCHTQLFTPKRLASFEHIRTEEVHWMMRVLREHARKGETINLKKWLTDITSNNMTRMVFSKRYFCHGVDEKDEEEEEAQQFQLMIANVYKIFVTFHIEEFIPSLRFLSKLRGWEKWALEVKRDALSICAKMLELEKRKQRQRDTNNTDRDHGKHEEDLVDVLMSMGDGEEPLSDEALMLSVLLDLLVGGTESSVTTVEWAMTKLIQHPNILKQAQKELDAVVGSYRVVQESDIPNLPYLQAVVKEVFRLHASSPFTIPRISNQEVEIKGYNVPAHTRLIVNLFSVHRDPKVYANPDDFRPDRFFVEHPEISASPEKSSYQLVPFGAGRRGCVGSALGSLMVHIMLAHILHAFDWSLPFNEDPQKLDMSEVLGGVAPKKIPLVLVAQPRDPVSLY